MLSSAKKYHVVIYFLIGISCNNDSSVESNLDAAPYEIKGTISDWNLGDTVEIVLGEYQFTRNNIDSIILFGSYKINKDGSYIFYLTTPNEELVRPSPVGFNPSDTSARFAFLEKPILRNKQKRVGYIYFRDKPEVITTDFIHKEYFLYSTKDVSVKGVDTLFYFKSNPLGVMTIIINKNININKGWNKIVVYRKSYENDIYRYETYRDNSFQSKTQFKYPL